jgi:hypothetical protein
MFISIFTIQTLHNITNSCIFSDIGRIAKFLMRTFTYRSTFLYDSTIKLYMYSMSFAFTILQIVIMYS